MLSEVSGGFDLIAPSFLSCAGVYELPTTTSLLGTSTNFAIMNGAKIPEPEDYVIGYAVNCGGLADVCEQRFPNAQIRAYPNQDALLDAMKSGEINLMVNSTFIWTYLKQMSKYEAVVVLPDTPMIIDILIAAGSQETSCTLLTILNLAIRSIADNYLLRIVTEYTTILLH